MSTNPSNWQAGIEQSNFHFDWQRQEPAGYDYRWIGRFSGYWESALERTLKIATSKTWESRGKKRHPQDADLESELRDLRQAGIDPDKPIFHKTDQLEPVFQRMVDFLGMTDVKANIHIQHPGEMLQLHVDKQREMNNDPNQVARMFIFLEDWKPGHFIQMGTSFLRWRKGDIIYFDWRNIPHATANAGWEPRSLVQVTGTITSATQELLSGIHNSIDSVFQV